jgi:dipeptidyl-peptidase-4
MRPALTCLLATAALLAACPASPAEKPLELAQIFGPSAVSLERRPAIQWLAGGDAYSTLEPAKTIAGGVDVVRYDTATGKRSIAVQAEALITSGAAKPLAAIDHDWSPNFQVLLLKTAGDDWLFNFKTKALRQLGRNLPQPALLHPEFSPDSSRVAYVAANNLHVEAVDGSQSLELTADGSDLILNGRGDLAYEEEFSLSKAFKWSPDSRRIAYWQFDTSGVGTFYMIRNTDGQYSKPVPLRYPKPGTTNSGVKVGVVSAAAPGTTWLALSGDPRENYVPRMDWVKNGDELLVQYENRSQNTNQILIGDAATGAMQPVMVEHDDSWLIPSDEVRWLNGGRAFTWLSERDGWMHLYVVSRVA